MSCKHLCLATDLDPLHVTGAALQITYSRFAANALSENDEMKLLLLLLLHALAGPRM